LKYLGNEIALVPSQKAQKIDLNSEYPCPCRRRGSLIPITLTEAFGCNRCQQIFVVEETGYVIEQLSTNYPYKRSWRWTGHRWSSAHAGLRENYFPVAIGMIAIAVFLMLLALKFAPRPNIVWILPIVLVGLFLGLWPWFAYRR
jgi:hypothetical protein